MIQKIKHRIWNRITMSRVTQPLLGRLGSDGERDLWIFILGNYNSGTTLLYEILRNQNGVSSLPWEGSRLTHHFTDPNDYGWPRMWHACLESMQKSESKLSAVDASHIKRQWKWSTRSKQKVFIEKSITNAIRIPFLKQYFTPAFFIHIVRNPYASCEGIQRKAKPNQNLAKTHLMSYPLSMCAQQWVRSNKMIEEGLEGTHSIRIRYEDLCKNPEETIKKITIACPELNALGVSLENHERLKVHGLDGLISDQNQVSISRLTKSDLSEVTHIASKMMEHYGYSITE